MNGAMSASGVKQTLVDRASLTGSKMAQSGLKYPAKLSFSATGETTPQFQNGR